MEPPTSGKVILHTSYGPLEVELWCHECPLFTRNFIQLCLEGYYEQTIFHRLLRGFILQGGDPTGTGSGGHSVSGQLVPPEYHMRLKWTRRGLVGVAGMEEGGGGGGGSQFFITFAPALDLYRKATLFGKIVGDTIYNLVRMGELPVERGTERPVDPPVLLRAEVVLNPFEDIIPRELAQVQERRELARKRDQMVESAKPRKPAAIKNRNVLSFDEGEDGGGSQPGTGPLVGAKIKSIHETLDDPTLSRHTVAIEGKVEGQGGDVARADAATPLAGSSGPARQDWRAELEALKNPTRVDQIKSEIASVQREIRQMSSALPAAEAEQASATAPTTARIDSLAQLLGTRKASVTPAGPSVLEEQRAAYKERRKVIMGKRGRSAADEMDTLLALNMFRSKLKSADPQATDPARLPAVEPERQLDICKLHGLVNCQSCRDTFGGAKEDGTEEGWLMHRLVFDKDAGYRELRADLDQLQVIDPRARADQFKQ